MSKVELTPRQRQIADLKTGRPFEPTTPDQVAKELGIPLAIAARELEAITAFVQAELTDRQRQIADLYNGGLGTTQTKVAKELGISRVTVARALTAMRDLFEEEGDFQRAVETVEPDFSFNIYHQGIMGWDEREDYKPLFGGPSKISRTTAYRRSAKEWGYAPEQRDKILHELKIARRAVNRAIKLIDADDGKATPEAWQERDKIKDLIMGTYEPSG